MYLCFLMESGGLAHISVVLLLHLGHANYKLMFEDNKTTISYKLIK